MPTAALEAGQITHSQTGRAATARPVQNLHNNSSDDEYSIQTQQVQFLATRFAMPVSIAGTIAALAWGVHHG